MVHVETVHIDDVSVEETWARLKADPKAVLVDVRTSAEWAFVGMPDLSSLGKRVLALEWQTFPDNSVDGKFTERMTAALAAGGAGKADEVFFICRSGVRSRKAAEAMAAAGFGRCQNVAHGFEGPPDDARQRGKVAGWKAAGLPWTQG